MNFWKKLFRAKEPPKKIATKSGSAQPTTLTNQNPTAKPEKSVLLSNVEKEWTQFFELVPIHESVQSFFKSFVGSWPTKLTPVAFSENGFSEFLIRLQSHINGPYPVATLNKPENPVKPSYQMVNGKIGRGYSLIIDMLIWNVIPSNQISNEEPHMIVWRLIEKYSSWPLAKLLFALPIVIKASKDATGGKAGILVIEDVHIQVYKGVENIIFGAYEDLPEGGYLSDDIIDKKIRMLLPS